MVVWIFVVVNDNKRAARPHPFRQSYMELRRGRLLSVIGQKQNLISTELSGRGCRLVTLDLHRFNRQAAHEKRQRKSIEFAKVFIRCIRSCTLEHQRIRDQNANILGPGRLPMAVRGALLHLPESMEDSLEFCFISAGNQSLLRIRIGRGRLLRGIARILAKDPLRPWQHFIASYLRLQQRRCQRALPVGCGSRPRSDSDCPRSDRSDTRCAGRTPARCSAARRIPGTPSRRCARCARRS